MERVCTAKVSMAIALSAGCTRCALVSRVTVAEIAPTHGDDDFRESRLPTYPVVLNTTHIDGPLCRYELLKFRVAPGGLLIISR